MQEIRKNYIFVTCKDEKTIKICIFNIKVGKC